MRSSIIFLIVVSILPGCAVQDGAVTSVDDYKTAAAAAVVALDVESALESIGDDGVVFVDVREGDEVARNRMIAGAVHVPRGVLEFYIDPDSSMHMELFSSGKKVVFYCATGGRSLLAAKLALDMGVADPVYLDGGYKAWSEAGGSTTP